MNLSKDLSDTFNEKMQQTHDAKDLDGKFSLPSLLSTPIFAPCFYIRI